MWSSCNHSVMKGRVVRGRLHNSRGQRWLGGVTDCRIAALQCFILLPIPNVVNERGFSKADRYWRVLRHFGDLKLLGLFRMGGGGGGGCRQVGVGGNVRQLGHGQWGLEGHAQVWKGAGGKG